MAFAFGKQHRSENLSRSCAPTATTSTTLRRFCSFYPVKTTLQTSQKNADPLAESFAGVFFLRLSGVDDGNIQFMEKMFPINTSVRGVRIRFKKNAKTPGILQSIGCFFSNKNCGRMMRFLSFNCIVRSWEWWFLLVSTQKTDGAMFQWIT